MVMEKTKNESFWKKNWKDNKNWKGQQLKGQKLKGFKMYVDMFQGLVTGLQKSQTTWNLKLGFCKSTLLFDQNTVKFWNILTI